MPPKKTYLCLHGHFYQPPRENPWIEEIESQDNVGGGFHDWNERISSECYRPNALARILDASQNIEHIVNNFEWMSFNVGPTLLSWLEKYDRRTYDCIMEADKKSILAHNGHGNAIAQVYNHIIMPLANRRDKTTQVRWGIADFKKRFGRFPEGMWLPETACNEETLEILVEEGIRFIILEPSQAEKFRHFGDKHWNDVSNASIDPTRPYRLYLEKQPQQYIDIFFYDGPISKAVAFDDLLYDSKIYANRLETGYDPTRKHTQLIHVATDGETYGHHKAFGDRVLAYLLKIEAVNRGFIITNYAEFLEKYPPEFEVKLKVGENGLGTSWSCPHGVRRWMDHCGCRGGGDGHWRQDWRKPLRETFDWLRDELSEIYVREGSRYFMDAWSARNDYVDLILDRSGDARKTFFVKHETHPLSKEDIVIALKLLEMQRNSMLMYTSCGWFFTEISGEETVQVMKYATRALQLAEEISGANIAKEFLSRLSKAKSNIEYFKDGVGVFDYLVRPSIATLERVVCHFAISSLFYQTQEKFRAYCYEFSQIDSRKETIEDLTLSFGHVKVRSTISLEEIDAVYVLLQSELYDFYCYVKPYSEVLDYHQLSHELFSEFMLGHRNKVGKIVFDHFGKSYYSLKDLFKDEKKKILEWLSKDGIDRFKELYEELYSRHRRMIDVYRLSKIPLPEEYQFIVEHKLSDEFNHLVTEKIFAQPEIFERAYAIRAWAKETGLKLNRKPSQIYLTRKLTKNMEDLYHKWDNEKVKDSCETAKIATQLGIELDKRHSQENYLDIIIKLDQDRDYAVNVSFASMLNFRELGKLLEINIERYRTLFDRFTMNPV